MSFTFSKHKHAINIYFDMDGVLAEYEPYAYQSNNDNTPKFIDPRAHYYANVPVDDYMHDLTQILALKLHLQRTLKINLFAITRLHDNVDIAIRQMQDKQLWLNKHYSHIDHFKPCLSFSQPKNNLFDTKAEIITTLYNHTLTPYDILIDDFNPELTSWQSLGGTAIKYINSLNTETSYNGIHFNKQTAAIDNITWLLTLAKQLQNS